MSAHHHAVVWVDHRRARIFHIDLAGYDQIVIRSRPESENIHHKANEIGAGHATEDEEFMGEIATALQDAGRILILGPGNEKNALYDFLQQNNAEFRKRVVAIGSSDHPSDEEVIDYAQRYFGFERPRIVSSR
ncbi:MAG: translational machinery protein [Rhizobiales bacterium]|nr:translational machinery protein [Hyphomicrobiales bacterium]